MFLEHDMIKLVLLGLVVALVAGVAPRVGGPAAASNATTGSTTGSTPVYAARDTYAALSQVR